MKLGIIGVGNMGEALLKMLSLSEFIIQGVSDKDINRRRYIRAKYKRPEVYESNAELIRACEVNILAVKPKDIDELLKEIKYALRPGPVRDIRLRNVSNGAGHLFITILAGISTTYIESRLGKVRVMRAMPNAPFLFGAGVTAISRGRYAFRRDISLAKKIFGKGGEAIEVKESLMNRITALSGSGPAYFAYLFGALLGASTKLGLERRIAERLLCHTLIGSGVIMKKRPFNEVIKMVASRGGTTEAALEVFERRNFSSIVEAAIRAAAIRADELTK